MLEKSSNELNKINNYLEEFFENWLINDIKQIKNHNLTFTLPYILLVSAGIDFLGGLICGFNYGSSKRSCKFIKEWMGEIQPLYRESSMSDFLYDNVRNGAVHFSIYKKYASCSSNSKIYPQDKHLFINIRDNNDDRIIIQVFQLIDDFIKAYYLFKEYYIKVHYKDAYNKLNSMLKHGKNFEELILSLKQKGKIYYPKAESIISTTNVDSSSPSIKFGSSASPSEAYFKKY